MELINSEDIAKINISGKECLEIVDNNLKNKESFLLPPKISIKPEPEMFYNFMPCVCPAKNIAGVKVVNRYPNKKPSLNSDIMLYNYKNGNLKAVIDGNWITATRTGAVAVHTINLLANKEYKEIGMIGLGSTAHATFRILLETLQGRKITVKLYKYKNQAEEFAKEFQGNSNISFKIVDKYEDVVENSDIIISCVTYQEGNFCDEKYFKEGCLVIPVHTRGFQNCDLCFDKVFADDIEHIKGFKYFSQFRSVAEIADVLKKRKPGRENNKERIIAYNIGIAIHDLIFADLIYKKVIDENK